MVRVRTLMLMTKECMYSCNHTCIITCHFMQTVQLKCLKFNDNYIFSTGNGFTGTRPYSIDNGGQYTGFKVHRLG